jgi:anti-anti-sigma factor
LLALGVWSALTRCLEGTETVTISTRQAGNVVVLDLMGCLTGAAAAGEVEAALRALGRAGTRTLVVNLARVPSIDMTGLAALVDGHREVRAGGGELRLAGFSRGVGDLAIVTRLATMCNVFDSVEQAIEGAIPVGPVPPPGKPRTGIC